MKTYRVVNSNNRLVLQTDNLDKAIKRGKQDSYKLDTQILVCDDEVIEAVVVTYSKGKEI